MKKILFSLFLVFGLFTIFTNVVRASCEYTDPTATSCTPPLGLCIGSDWKNCCSDSNSCYEKDPGNVAWIPAPTPTPGIGQTPLPTPAPDRCQNQSAGDCTSPSLPQACLVNGTYYNCCNTEQACRNLPGTPVDEANPNNQNNTNSAETTCDSGKGINTAIGCLHVLESPNVFLTELLRWATGIGGGIAFLLMLYAGFMIMTAQGNPDRIQAGKELLMSAIGGLILLVLSIFILKLIGIDILGLDAFGFGQSQ